MPKRKNAVTIAISHIWNHKEGMNEGMAIPENRGFKITVTAVKAIINAIVFVSKKAPFFHIITRVSIKEFQYNFNGTQKSTLITLLYKNTIINCLSAILLFHRFPSVFHATFQQINRTRIHVSGDICRNPTSHDRVLQLIYFKELLKNPCRRLFYSLSRISNPLMP